MKAVIYNQEGKKSGDMELSESVFNLPWNADLVHQVSVSMQANERSISAHVKDRSMVAGTGKKPWRQKGTGRARHGSRMSPIWVGGGVAHGPNKNRNYSKSINKKMKRKALYTVLSQKFRDNEIVFLDKIDVGAKTKEAVNVLKNVSKLDGFEKLATKRKNKAILALETKSDVLGKSSTLGFRNIAGMNVSELKSLNAVDLLTYKYIVIPFPEQALSAWK